MGPKGEKGNPGPPGYAPKVGAYLCLFISHFKTLYIYSLYFVQHCFLI